MPRPWRQSRSLLRGVVERSHHEAQAWVEAAGPPAARVPFERERRACLDARDRDSVLEMRSIAGNLVRLSETREQRTMALDLRAEANVRLGRREEAIEHAALLSPGARRLLAARLALLEGDYGAALQQARAASSLLGERNGERQRCFALISQAQLELPGEWRPSPEEAGFSRDLWARVAVDVERARHLVRDGDWREAERIARRVAPLRADPFFCRTGSPQRRGHASRRTRALRLRRRGTLARARRRTTLIDAGPLACKRAFRRRASAKRVGSRPLANQRPFSIA